MRKLILSATAGVLVLTLLVVVFSQRRKLSLAESREQRLESMLAENQRQINELSQARNNASRRLEGFFKESQQTRIDTEKKIPASNNDVHSKVEFLKEALARLPEQGIPELRLASDSDWYASVDGELDSVNDYRRAFAKLRSLAEQKFAKGFQPILREYLDANGGRFPTDTYQLQPFLHGDVDVAMLQRYKVVPAKEVSSVSVGGEWAITQASVIDSEYDSHSVFGPRGFGTFSRR